MQKVRIKFTGNPDQFNLAYAIGDIAEVSPALAEMVIEAGQGHQYSDDMAESEKGETGNLKVRIIKDPENALGILHKAGDEVEIPVAIARKAIAEGYALEAPEGKALSKAPASKEVETATAGPGKETETATVKPKKKNS
jgi:hypothetical protein